jgi:4a-hydroxytetrahydrobiopterin dehydratase
MSGSMFMRRDWSRAPRRPLTPTEIVTRLAELPGWKLAGDGPDIAIEKTYTFASYDETIGFVNALAFVANRMDHHPDLSVHYGRCVVRFSTHSLKGLSETDFECARAADALLA